MDIKLNASKHAQSVIDEKVDVTDIIRSRRSVLYLPALELQSVRLFLGVFCCPDVILQVKDEKITRQVRVSSAYSYHIVLSFAGPLTKAIKIMPRFSMRLQTFRISPYGL